MKTLAIRLEEDLHAALSVIAKLEELTVTDAIRSAVEDWVATRRDNPELRARAEAVLADIDRDAAARRTAVAALLSSDTKQPTLSGEPQKRTGQGRGSRGGEATS